MRKFASAFIGKRDKDKVGPQVQPTATKKSEEHGATTSGPRSGKERSNSMRSSNRSLSPTPTTTTSNNMGSSSSRPGPLKKRPSLFGKNSRKAADPYANLPPLPLPPPIQTVPALSTSSGSSDSSSVRTPEEDSIQHYRGASIKDVSAPKASSGTGWFSAVRRMKDKSEPPTSFRGKDLLGVDWRPRSDVVTAASARPSESAESSDSDPSDDYDEEPRSSASSNAVARTAVSPERCLSNLHAVTLSAINPPPSPHPLLQNPTATHQFPRSINLSTSLPPSPAVLRLSMHRTHILNRIESRKRLSPSEERSIIPFGSRSKPIPVPSTRPREPKLTEEEAMLRAGHSRGWSRGLKKWVERPPFEERAVVWAPQFSIDGEIGWRAVAGKAGTAVAELEYSEGLEALAGEHGTMSQDFDIPPTTPSPNGQPANPTKQLPHSLAMAPVTHLSVSPSPSSPSATSPTTPTSATGPRRGVRFAEEVLTEVFNPSTPRMKVEADPSDDVPLAVTRRKLEKERERIQKAKELEEQRRRERERELELEREREAKEAERQRKFQEEVVAQRMRRETYRLHGDMADRERDTGSPLLDPYTRRTSSNPTPSPSGSSLELDKPQSHSNPALPLSKGSDSRSLRSSSSSRPKSYQGAPGSHFTLQQLQQQELQQLQMQRGSIYDAPPLPYPYSPAPYYPMYSLSAEELSRGGGSPYAVPVPVPIAVPIPVPSQLPSPMFYPGSHHRQRTDSGTSDEQTPPSHSRYNDAHSFRSLPRSAARSRSSVVPALPPPAPTYLQSSDLKARRQSSFERPGSSPVQYPSSPNSPSRQFTSSPALPARSHAHQHHERRGSSGVGSSDPNSSRLPSQYGEFGANPRNYFNGGGSSQRSTPSRQRSYIT